MGRKKAKKGAHRASTTSSSRPSSPPPSPPPSSNRHDPSSLEEALTSAAAGAAPPNPHELASPTQTSSASSPITLDSLAPTTVPPARDTPNSLPPEARTDLGELSITTHSSVELSPASEQPSRPASEQPSPPSSKAHTAEATEGERPSQREQATKDAPQNKHSSGKIALEEDELHKNFFAGAEAAVAQLHADARKAAHLEEAILAPPSPILSPEQLARRHLLRKVVGGVVGVASVLALLVFLRVAIAPKKSDLATLELPPMPKVAAPITSIPTPIDPGPSAVPLPSSPDSSTTAAPADSSFPEQLTTSTEPLTSAVSAVASAPEASPSATTVVPTSSASTVASSAEPAAAASHAPDTTGSAGAPTSSEQAKALTKQALRLLEQGSYKGAIEKASASVEADPTDANAYLYWGTALMSLGKMKEAKEIFTRCTEKATRGPTNECRKFR
ncbi:MAG: tetratricopeptide repeat protein [Myxococcales bacterium]|nr:tetratricopeptide repeat protein [Polyangiaceae bacterium]MDW8248305.1 tetratricopeptide repeat protein [Myxococcales bacterium]